MEYYHTILLGKMTEKTVSIACKEPDYSPKRLDKYLFERFTDYSRTYFQGLIRKNLVLVNGEIMPKSSYLVQFEDLISFPFIKPETSDTVPINVDFDVIYENEDFLIVCKPAGLVVHNSLSNKGEPSLVSGLLYRFQEFQNFDDNLRPGIVHRLDKDTSGLLVVARNRPAHIILSQLFKDRHVSKTYLAVVKGHPDKTGKVTAMIGRHPVHRHKMFYQVNPSSDEISHSVRKRGQGTYRGALTYFDVMKYYDEHTLVAAHPVTGRTHQIRVHLSSLGFGIVGDKMYGHESKRIGRQALHAWKLAFEFKGEKYSFQSPIPQDFSRLLKDLYADSDCQTQNQCFF